MTITIPDSMKSAPNGYTRTFRIIRVHDGVAEVLTEGTGAALEISSDKFSSYFLVYKDTKTEAVTEAPKTGDSMPIAVLIVFMLSAAGTLVFLNLKKKKN